MLILPQKNLVSRKKNNHPIIQCLNRLIDGSNVTMSDEHMWLVPFTDGESHVLQITFDAPKEMTGLRVWNYNKSHEDTYRGVRRQLALG